MISVVCRVYVYVVEGWFLSFDSLRYSTIIGTTARKERVTCVYGPCTNVRPYVSCVMVSSYVSVLPIMYPLRTLSTISSPCSVRVVLMNMKCVEERGTHYASISTSVYLG